MCGGGACGVCGDCALSQYMQAAILCIVINVNYWAPKIDWALNQKQPSIALISAAVKHFTDLEGM